MYFANQSLNLLGILSICQLHVESSRQILSQPQDRTATTRSQSQDGISCNSYLATRT